ncbi:RNA-directed DNA polymerase, eukaryota [Tanacetum coccineum]
MNAMGHETVCSRLEKTKIDEAQTKDVYGPRDGNNADFYDGPSEGYETLIIKNNLVVNKDDLVEQNNNQESSQQTPKGEKRAQSPVNSNYSDYQRTNKKRKSNDDDEELEGGIKGLGDNTKGISEAYKEYHEIISINVRGMGEAGKKGWVNSIIRDERPDVIGLQETKMDVVDEAWVEELRGSRGFGFTQLSANGNSSDILLIWDSSSFSFKDVRGDERFVAVKRRMER